jgi:hypothetical protein
LGRVLVAVSLYHFPDVKKTIEAGNGAQQIIDDIIEYKQKKHD